MTECSAPTLCLIDGSGYIFRAFYALPPMTRLDGTPINAVYGFTSMMLNLLQENCCQQIVVVFDAKRQNYRNDIYPQYKANRTETPPDLIPQFPLIRRACDALNIAHIELEGYEADDLIATYTQIAKQNHQPVRIISADKDLMQLMQDNVTLYDPMKKKEITIQDTQKKFGVTPDKIIEVQSLMGDSIDNIPGASGVGPKTAATLIQQYGSIENLYQHIDEMKPSKQRENLIRDRENVFISKKLVTLKTDVPVDTDLTKFQQKDIDFEKIKDFILENNFKSLLARLPQNTPKQSPAQNATTQHIIQNDSELDQTLTALIMEKQFAFNILTTDSEITKLEFYTENESFQYSLPTQRNTDLFQTKTDPLTQRNKELLSKLLSSDAIKYTWDVKHQMHALKQLQIDVKSPYHDVMLMSYDLDGTRHEHNLDTVGQIYFKNSNTINILQLGKTLTQKLHDENLWGVYNDIDLPTTEILFQMEKNGFLIDQKPLLSLQTKLDQKLADLSNRIHAITNPTLNINSPSQLGVEFFETRKLPGGKRGTNGHWITDVRVLERLADEENDPLAKLVLQYRSLSKLKSTYIDTLLQRYQQSPRIHTNLSLVATNTGRLASSNPNLQNIPIKSELGKEIRSAFIAKPGYTLVSADYSQIELRLIAHVAKVKKLQESFIKGEDIHARTASQILNIPLNEITPDQRRQAKAVNFGIIYGISAFGLARNLGISRTQANDYIQSYFNLYPEIKDYMKREIDFAHQNQYVLTPYGRKIYINGLNQHATKAFAERAAINAPIQGGAADIIKMAMIRVANAIKDTNIPAQPIMQIHDELIFEVPESDAPKLKELLIHHMQGVVQLSVPLVVEVGTGPNWQAAH